MGAVSHLRMNERAWAIADRCAERAAELRIEVHHLENGARVIDAGINTPGGFAAGLALADMGMGGLGHVALGPVTLDGETFAGISVWTDHPVESCMASQYAGWAISTGDFFAMGSGPLRAKARVETELFATLAYGEDVERGVLVLEGRARPDDRVAEWIAGKAGITPSHLTLVIAPTASIAGGVQIVARSIETGLHKMHTLGFDIGQVDSAMGFAPLPPVAKNDVRAIGRTNDCVLYGARATYTVRATDEALAALAERLPSTSSRDYGTPFYETFTRCNNDFYKIDPLLFSPAAVTLTSSITGHSFHGGRINLDVLRRSFQD